MRWLLLLISQLTFAGEIALTFDDAPRSNSHFSGTERAKRLLTGLAGHQAAFFCNSSKMDATGKARIQSYSDAGHIIANHSHTHPDLDKVKPAAFIADIQTAHDILKTFKTFQPWFRFLFLHEGKTIEDRDAVREFLSSAGYKNGYVTIDTYDWYMEVLFQDALETGKKIDFEKLGDLYVQILWEGIQFYDAIALNVLGRSPKHVLLLHENDLAALFVKKLITRIESEGFKIISPLDAYKDPIASMEPNTLRLNQGRVAAIAKDKEYTGSLTSKWEDEREIDGAFAGIIVKR